MNRQRRPAKRAHISSWRRYCVAAGVALVLVGVIPTFAHETVASASGPTYTLGESTPSTVLYGSSTQVTLTTTDTDTIGSSASPAYNLSYRDVLSAGVSYVAGSTSGTIGNPTIYDDEPASGETTLVWSNVADLQPASSMSISFSLQGLVDSAQVTCSTALCPGASYTNSATVYVSDDPRYVEQFDSTTGVAEGGVYFSDQTASASTTIQALKTTLTDDLPEAELERGVHDQQHTWTLTTTNNSVHATALSEIDAYLPAGLEFLSCGNANSSSADGNTTDAHGTNEGSPTEYPGAPSMASSSPIATDCPAPTSTTTIQLSGGSSNPDGIADGIYTYVQWEFGTSSGDIAPTTLAVSGTYVIKYLAAVPLRENSLDWGVGASAGTAPSGSSDDQIANLDNNQGPDTSVLSTSGAGQTSLGSSSGVYSGDFSNGNTGAISAYGTDTVTIHDIAVQESITTSGAGCASSSTSFVAGQIVCFALTYETSEYRFSAEDPTFANGVQLVDTVPNGLCPIDNTTNYDQSASGSANNTECAPEGGVTPSSPYSSVVEDDGITHPANDGNTGDPPAGDFTVTWNLGTLPPDTSSTLEFPALDRASYQQYSGAAFSAGNPTLTGDPFSDSVEITSDTYATCQVGGTLDSTCSNGASSAIYPAGEPGGPTAAASGSDADEESNPSSASQSASQPTISKTIGSPIGGSCTSGVSYSSSPANAYQLGDLVCFQLTVDFPSGEDDRDPIVTDYLPPNSTYDAAASGVDSTNTVTIPSSVPSDDPVAGSYGGDANPIDDTSSGDGEQLVFFTGAALSSCTSACDLYSSSAQVFTYDVGATINAAPTDGNDFDLTQNLLKFTSYNSAGLAVSNRSDVTYDVADPNLTLVKGVESVNGSVTTDGSANGATFASNIDGIPVDDGDSVEFRVDISNSGEVPAVDPTVWDVLGSGISCSDIGAISDSGTCYASGAAAPTGISSDSTATVSNATVVWTGTDIASIAASGTDTETVVFDVPSAAATGDNFDDTAGVVSYLGEPDTGAGNETTYVPQSGNVLSDDGDSVPSPAGTLLAAPNSPTNETVSDPSSVVIASPVLTKAVSPSAATIGEDVTYTLTASVPTGSTLYSGVLSDALGTSSPRLSYQAGSAAVSCTGGPVTGTVTASGDNGIASDGTWSFTLAASAGTNTVALDFPSSISVGSSSSTLVCTVTFSAEVNDVASNVRGALLANTASLSYDNDSGSSGTGSPVSATAHLTVEDPDLSVTKTDNASGSATPHIAQPGATVTYTITASNISTTDVSTAYDVNVVDTLPTGETYVSGSANDGGTFDGSSTITWSLASLAKGASQSLTYEASLPANPTGLDNYENTVVETGESLAGGGRTSSTATTEGIGGYRATASDTVDIPSAAVTKAADPTSVPVGVASTFTDTVTIPANIVFPDLTAIDVLPDGLTFGGYVSATCSGGCTPDLSNITTESATTSNTSGKTAIAWWLGNVTASTTARTVVLTYTAYPAETNHAGSSISIGSTLDNTVADFWSESDSAATGSAPSPDNAGSSFGFAHGSSSASASITVTGPAVTISKSVASSSLAPGTEDQFSVTLTNGNSDASTADLAEVSDAVPALLSVNASTISDGGTLSGTAADGSGGTITWDLAGSTLAPSATKTLTYDAELAPSDDFTPADSSSAITNTATLESYFAVANATAVGDASRYDTYGPASTTASVTPVFPGLAVAKYIGLSGIATTGSANIDSPADFHVVVSSTTGAGFSEIGVVDELPPYWSYDSGSTVVTTSSGGTLTGDPTTSTDAITHVETLHWTNLGALGAVSSGQHVLLSYAATPKPGATIDGSGNTNTAYATGIDATGAAGIDSGGSFSAYESSNATANDSVGEADLTITKSHSGSFLAGGDGSYTLAIANSGPDAAAEPITVTDELPVGEGFVSASGTGWTCSSSGAGVGAARATVVCTFGSDGSSAPVGTIGGSITLDVAVAASVTPGVNAITNTASVAANGTYDPDTSLSSSSDPATVTSQADLEIANTLVDPVGGLVAGEHATYTLAVSNLGPSDAMTPEIEDVLPSGESYVSATGAGWSCSDSGATVTCTYASSSLPVGSSAAAVSLVVGVASSLTTAVTNTAVVCSGTIGAGSNSCAGANDADGTPDPATSNNSSSAAGSPAVAAHLEITKTHSGDFVAGLDGSYTIDVTDEGPADSVATSSTPIVVSDTLPGGESYVAATGAGWSCSDSGQIVTCDDDTTIEAGSSAPSITVTVAVDPSAGAGAGAASALVTNTAQVTPGVTPDSDPTQNSVSDPTSVVNESDLSIVKLVEGTFTLDRSGEYSLTVANAGPSDNPGPVVITDDLPKGERLVSASGQGWTCNSGMSAESLQCTLAGSLSSGSTAPPVSVHVEIGLAAYPTVKNTATASSPTLDPVSSNNSSTAVVSPTAIARLKLKKYLVGQLVSDLPATFDIVARNLGPSSASAVNVVDDLPAGLSAMRASGSGWHCDVLPAKVTCLRASLAVGISAPIVVVAQVDARPGVSIVNSAHADSSTPPPGSGDQLAVATSKPAVVVPDPVGPAASRLPTSNAGSAGLGSTQLAFTGLNLVPILLGGLLLMLAGCSLAMSSAARTRRLQGIKRP